MEQPTPPFPKQHQYQPGIEAKLWPRPHYQARTYRPARKLEKKVALITGGDSGIGRAVAILFAKEGADVAITFLPSEREDAFQTRDEIKEIGTKSLLIEGDLRTPAFCERAVQSTVEHLGKLDILVSNAAHQSRHSTIEELTEEDWQQTFETNIDALFRLCKAAVPRMREGSSIIATSSTTGFVGSASLLDYSATKGAINAFIKALSQMLIPRGIRVNAVAPGPVWTPLNPADPGLSAESVAEFGSKVPYGRPAQPEEIAPAYVFLASDADSSYITGLVLPELGGETSY